MCGYIPCKACLRKIMRFKYVNKYALMVSFVKHEYHNSPARINLVFNKSNAAGMKAVLLRGAGIVYIGEDGILLHSGSFFFLTNENTRA